jgi:hypothetical protein
VAIVQRTPSGLAVNVANVDEMKGALPRIWAQPSAQTSSLFISGHSNHSRKKSPGYWQTACHSFESETKLQLFSAKQVCKKTAATGVTAVSPSLNPP